MFTFIKTIGNAIVTGIKAMGTFVVGIGTGALGLVGLSPAAQAAALSVAADGTSVPAVVTAETVTTTALIATAAPWWYYPTALAVVFALTIMAIAATRTAWRWCNAAKTAEEVGNAWRKAQAAIEFPFAVVYDAGSLVKTCVASVGSWLWSSIKGARYGVSWTCSKISFGCRYCFSRGTSTASSIVDELLLKSNLAEFDPEAAEELRRRRGGNVLPGQA